MPSLTSVIKSGEFYDRYDFLVDYSKTVNPQTMDCSTMKFESNTTDTTIKIELNDDTSTETPAYSIISNALGVTAMSTLVTKSVILTCTNTNVLFNVDVFVLFCFSVKKTSFNIDMFE
jgi:hypothetical protein